MTLHVSGHSPSSGAPASTHHGSGSPESTSPGQKPSGSHGPDGPGNVPSPGAPAGAGGNSSTLNTQMQNFIVQVGQQILKSGQDGWANAKDDDDDS